jgi:PST family polysaccharide transporter
VAWTALDRWSNRLVNLVVFALLARLLTPEQIGVAAVVLLAIEFTEMYVAQGLGFALVQRQDLTKAHVNTAFWTQIFAAVAAASVLFVAAPFAGTVLGSPFSPLILIALLPLLLVTALSRVPVALLTRRMEFKRLAVRNVAQTIAGGVVGVGAAAAGLGVWALVAMHLTKACTGVVVLWTSTEWRPALEWSASAFLDLGRYSWKVTVEQTVLFVSNRTDEATVAAALGPVAMGYYSLAKRLVTLLTESTLGVMNATSLPVLSRLQDDPERLRAALLAMSRLGATVVFPVFAGLAAVAGVAVPAVFGDAWRNAAPVVSMLALAAMLGMTPALVHMALHGLGKPGGPLLSNCVRAGVALGALPWVGPLGPVAVAGVFVGRGLFGAIVDLALVRRIGVVTARQLLVTWAAPALAAGVMAPAAWLAASWSSPLGDAWAALISCVCGAGVYCAVLASVSHEARRDIGRALRAAPGGARLADWGQARGARP